jgi:hypothetical protein
MPINKVLQTWRGAALRKMIELVENVDGSMDILLDGDGVTAGKALPKNVFNGNGDLIGITGGDGQVLAITEVSPYVNLTATGTAFSGECEFAGYICTVAAGNITVYDNTAASGTVIVPTTALVVGAFPIFGPGTNGKMLLSTGCHVVLSGAATVNMLVGG